MFVASFHSPSVRACSHASSTRLEDGVVLAPARFFHRWQNSVRQPARSAHCPLHLDPAGDQPVASSCKLRSAGCANFCYELHCPSSLQIVHERNKITRSYPLL